MKAEKETYLLLLSAFFLSIIFGSEIYSRELSEYYFRTASLPPYEREVKFQRIDYPVHFVTSLSMDDISDFISIESYRDYSKTRLAYSVDFISDDDTVNSVKFDYFICTSREDAETYALDIIGASDLVYTHAVDAGFDVEIGDNCWFSGNAEQWFDGPYPYYQDVIFVRNNVCINITQKELKDERALLNFARAVDEYVITESTSTDPLSVQAPTILSHSVISASEKEGAYTYRLDVQATDTANPNNTELYYRVYNSSHNLETDGTVSCYAVSDNAVAKIWVINKDHIAGSQDILLEYSGVFVEDSAPEPEQVFTLYANTPNPFNQATAIGYELVSAGDLTLAVYDMLGRKVAELERGWHGAGVYFAHWNGCDTGGEPVSSGVYFYRAVSGGVVQAGRMTVLR